MSGAPFFRDDIQILRGVAVIAVLVFHLDSDVFPNGYLGVDIFFVISGFVLARKFLPIVNAEDSNGRMRELVSFLSYRFWRLTPALLLTILLGSLLFLALMPIPTHQTYAMQSLLSLIYLGNVGAIKLSPNYFEATSNPMIHTWSLAVEWQFYSFFPIAILLSQAIFKTSFIKADLQDLMYLMFAVSSLLFVSQHFGYQFGSGIVIQEFGTSYYSPIFRAWEFITGCILGLKFHAQGEEKIRLNTTWHYLILVVFVLQLIYNQELNQVLASILIVGITSLVIYVRSFLVLRSRILSSLFVWVGERSYSIYLIHYPLVFIAKQSPFLNLGAENGRQIPTLLAVVLVFVSADFMYKYVELKYKFKLRRSNDGT